VHLARVLTGILHGRGRSCALSLIPILLVLLPLAHARPPDPVWIAGIYDEADLDDVVVAVASATGLETSGLSGKPVDAATRTVRPLLPVLNARTFSATLSVRAPPPATLIAIS